MTTRSYMSIGDVLALLRQEFPDVTISKIRFLESQGLVNPERTPSGYRKFYEADVDRLRWVLRQQREHFLPLKVIKGRLEAGGAAGSGQGGTTGPAPEADGGPRTPDAGSHTSDAGSHTSDAGRHPSPAGLRVVAPGGAAGCEPGPSRRHGTAGTAAGLRGEPPPVAAVAGLGMLPGFEVPRSSDHGAAAGERAAAAAGERGPAPGPGHGMGAAAAAAEQGVVAAAEQGPAAAGERGTTPGAGEGDASGFAAAWDRSGAAPGAAGAGSAEGAVRVVPAAEAVQAAGLGMTLDELCAASGLDGAQVAELTSYGLLQGRPVGGAVFYGEDAVAVARVAAAFARFGVEARHLRLHKHAAEREAGFIEQIVLPMVKQRNPEARRRATETAAELSRLGQALRGALLQRNLRDLLG